MSIQGQQTEKNGIKSGVARNVLRTPVQAPFSSSPPQGREPDTFRGKEPERVKAVFRNASHIKTAEAGFPKEMPLTLRSILRLNALRHRPSSKGRPLRTEGLRGAIVRRDLFQNTPCRTGKT